VFLRYLTNLGYAYHRASAMLSRLDSEGMIEVYKVPNLDGDYEVSAIRTKPRGTANSIADSSN
jgi:hypothetical protein